MGLWSKIKGEFIDIIEWLDDTNETLVYRFERYENEIKNGAKLVVREGQNAVFVNKGQIADIFTPGMYTLTTENMPVMSTLMGWKYGFNSPFKAEVYFVSMRIFTNLKWGTPNPVMMRDPELGPVRLRARGSYTIRITEPATFIKNIVGTDGNFTQEEVANHLRNILITSFVDLSGETKIPILDLAAKYEDLSKLLLEKTKVDFENYGITVEKILVENITLPEEVEKAIDARGSIGIIGNLNAYTQYQAAQSIKDFAQNPSNNMAAGGMGMGMGMAMGNVMSQSMAGNQVPTMQAPPPQMTEKYYVYQNNQQIGPVDLLEVSKMIQTGTVNRSTMVWKPGMANWVTAETISELVAYFNQAPPPPPMGN